MVEGNDFGYGQQLLRDSTDETNVIAFMIRRLIARMETMKLVKVTAVSSSGEVASSGTVDVQPLVSQVDGAGNAVPHGTVNSIPWFRLQGGHNAVICDPKVGDIGYVVVADRDISNVKASRAQSTPGSWRQHSLSDGVYVGGVLGQVPTNYILLNDDKVVLKFGSSSVTIDSTGIHLAGPIFMDGQVSGATAGATIDLGAGSITTTGDVLAGGKSLKLHVHSAVTTGAGISGPPV